MPKEDRRVLNGVARAATSVEITREREPREAVGCTRPYLKRYSRPRETEEPAPLTVRASGIMAEAPPQSKTTPRAGAIEPELQPFGFAQGRFWLPFPRDFDTGGGSSDPV